MGKRAFDAFFDVERNLTKLFETNRHCKISVQEYMDEQLEKKLYDFSPNERPNVQEIFYGMLNYMKFHSGDELSKLIIKVVL